MVDRGLEKTLTVSNFRKIKEVLYKHKHWQHCQSRDWTQKARLCARVCVRGCSANHMWSPLSTMRTTIQIHSAIYRPLSSRSWCLCPDVFHWFQAVDWVPNICSMHHNHVAGLPCQPVVYWNNKAQPELSNLAQLHRIPNEVNSRLTDSKASAAPPVEAHSQTSWYPSQGLGFAVLLFHLNCF